ncbi:uncharacterized protein [Montipora capricornis]|uniref:uncharacterized protein n=1 Tax=Montipora capricornis TaxID=246305 RepID=UPI0035F1ED96
MANKITAPEMFDFKKPDEWEKWIRRFGRYRMACDLHKKSEEVQVNTLLYAMGDAADDVMTTFMFEDEGDRLNHYRENLGQASGDFVICRQNLGRSGNYEIPDDLKLKGNLCLQKGDIKFEGVSPVEVTIKDEKYQHGIQHCGLHIKPPTHGISNEVRTQTPWRLKKPKPIQVAQCQNKRKGKPRKLINALVYSHQKSVQRERERAIRDKIKCLSTMLPWKDPKNNHPSRKDILESAARCIMQLLEDICESYLQKRLKTEELKAAALQGNMVFNLSNNNNNCQGDTCKVNDASLETDVGGSPSSTPDLVVDDDFSLKSASPASELSSQGSEVSDSTVPNGSKTRENAKHVKRPMNAFILFSKNHRTFFKQLYPGRDNRKISTLLAEKWRSMKPEEKEPYRLEAKELMRQTKESHPDFKYCDGVKKTGILTANGDSTRPPTCTLDHGYR